MNKQTDSINKLIDKYHNECIDIDNNTIINEPCKIILQKLNTYYKNHSIQYKKKIKLK